VKDRKQQTKSSTGNDRGLSLNKPIIKSAHVFTFVEMNEEEIEQGLDTELPDLESILTWLTGWLTGCVEHTLGFKNVEQKQAFALEELEYQFPLLCDESPHHRYVQTVIEQFCQYSEVWDQPHKLFMVVKYNAIFFDEKSYQQMCRACC
jgi:hypothetical protein